MSSKSVKVTLTRLERFVVNKKKNRFKKFLIKELRKMYYQCHLEKKEKE